MQWRDNLATTVPSCTVLGILRAALYSSVIWFRVWKSLSFDSVKLFSISSNCSISMFTVWEVFAQPGNPSSTLLDSMKLIWQKLAIRAQLCYVWIRPRMKQEVRINWPGWQVLHFFKRAKQPWEKYRGCTIFVLWLLFFFIFSKYSCGLR